MVGTVCYQILTFDGAVEKKGTCDGRWNERMLTKVNLSTKCWETTTSYDLQYSNNQNQLYGPSTNGLWCQGAIKHAAIMLQTKDQRPVLSNSNATKAGPAAPGKVASVFFTSHHQSTCHNRAYFNQQFCLTRRRIWDPGDAIAKAHNRSSILRCQIQIHSILRCVQDTYGPWLAIAGEKELNVWESEQVTRIYWL